MAGTTRATLPSDVTPTRSPPCALGGNRRENIQGPGRARPLTGPAVVDVRLAGAPRVARQAVAAVAAVGVLAGGSVAARALHTLVDVDLAGLPWGRSKGATGSARTPGLLHPVHPGVALLRPGKKARLSDPLPLVLGQASYRNSGRKRQGGVLPLERPLQPNRPEEAHSLLPWGRLSPGPPSLSQPLPEGWPEPGLQGAAGLTLPARGADAGKALIVLRRLAHATVPAGAGGTWGQHHLTRGS